MAVAYECPECRTRWPHYRAFQNCPECRVACRSAAVPKALTAGQAKTRLTQIAFIRYYQDRERQREGPTPEEVGRAEAKAEADRVRKLNESLKDPGE